MSMTIAEYLERLGAKEPNKDGTLPYNTPFTRFLLYSDFGNGKTHLIGTVHKMLKEQGLPGVYLADVDMGIKTLIGREGIEDLAFDTFVGPGAYTKLLKQIGIFLKEGTNSGYSCIAFDSLTFIQRIAMDFIQTQSKTKRALGFVANQHDYGLLVQLIQGFIQVLLRLSTTHTVILTAHLRERENPTTKMSEWVPSIVGRQLPSALGAWFNEVWYLRLDLNTEKQLIHVAQTISENSFKCKSQTQNMPRYVLAEEALKLSLGIGIGIGDKTK